MTWKPREIRVVYEVEDGPHLELSYNFDLREFEAELDCGRRLLWPLEESAPAEVAVEALDHFHALLRTQLDPSLADL